MRTWQAALAQVGITAAQAAAGVMFFQPNSVSGALGNLGVQSGVQLALTALTLWIAKKNSNTAPNGAPLVQTLDGKYMTLPPKV